MLGIRQAQYLVALDECRHFGRAADRVALTQPALTQSIKRLEEYYGVLLFNRGRGEISPTPFGEVILGGARRMIAAEEDTAREIELLRNAEVGQLRVGGEANVCGALLAPAFADLLADHPSLRFQQTSGDWQALRGNLSEKNIDMFVGFTPTHIAKEFVADSFELGRSLFIAAAGHPLDGKRNVSIQELFSYPFAGATPPDWTMDWIRSEYDDPSYDTSLLPIAINNDDIHMSKRIVLRSNAIMVALRPDVEDELEAGRMVSIDVPSWPRTVPVSVITLADRELPPIAVSLVEAIKRAGDTLKD